MFECSVSCVGHASLRRGVGEDAVTWSVPGLPQAQQFDGEHQHHGSRVNAKLAAAR